MMDGARQWEDAIVVAPQGEPRTFEQFGDRARPGWQVMKGELGDRDLAFFDAMVADLESRGCLDRDRVYSTGFSNGGFFTNVLGCNRGDVLAAIAPAGGGGPFERECKQGALPVLVTHGREDQVVEYAMGEGSFQYWTAHNGCSADARAPANACADAPGCPEGAAVRMCSLAIGHEWPADQAARTTEFLRAFTRP
jgi:poly(3-hydroxybutyrate) depolymerase